MSEQVNPLYKALIQFQTVVPVIPKNCVNPFFSQGGKKAMYADLATVIDTCKPHLNKSGLAVLQTMFVQDGRNALRTILAHYSGQTVASDIYLPEIQDPQKLTAAVTYLRRCQYLAILGLVADDDDDGNSVGQQPQKAAPATNTEKRHQGGTPFPASQPQLNLIRVLCQQKQHDPGPITGISAKDASALIDKLNKMEDAK